MAHTNWHVPIRQRKNCEKNKVWRRFQTFTHTHIVSWIYANIARTVRKQGETFCRGKTGRLRPEPHTAAHKMTTTHLFNEYRSSCMEACACASLFVFLTFFSNYNGIYYYCYLPPMIWNTSEATYFLLEMHDVDQVTGLWIGIRNRWLKRFELSRVYDSFRKIISKLMREFCHLNITNGRRLSLTEFYARNNKRDLITTPGQWNTKRTHADTMHSLLI